MSTRQRALDPSPAGHTRQRTGVAAIAAVAVLMSAVPGLGQRAQAGDTLHFAVGPLQPTPGETKKAYDPFFKYLAERLGAQYTLEATTDRPASPWH